MKAENSMLTFWMNGKKFEIDFNTNPKWRPDTTVLNFLRSLPGNKGTKEGCAEGDCGACTIVIAAPDEKGKMQYKACDSCLILLPMLHGKQIITVENLGNSAQLHPVQQAMVDCDGSQCGYCTPGFIMSMFALYKADEPLTRESVVDALTGNLCRCTGYKPIVEAAMKSCHSPEEDIFSANEEKLSRQISTFNESDRGLVVKNDSHIYLRPSSLLAALEFRAINPEALVVCGATDVGLMVTKKKMNLSTVLDISGIPELKIGGSVDGEMTFGSALSLEAVKALCKNHFPALYDMLAVFGSKQIRNLASLGGNLANASPIGDCAPVLIALQGSVELQSIRETRTIKISEFITGYRKTVLATDEIITAIIIPYVPKNAIVKSYKISKRKDLDISTVSAGFRLVLDDAKLVKEIVLVFGGMAAMTKQAKLAEDFLLGKVWSRSNAESAMEEVEKEFTPISDARSGKEGRRIMARNLLLKFWAETQISSIKEMEADR